MIWQFYIGLFAILGRNVASSTCSKTCTNRTVNAAGMESIASLCYPGNYADNTICNLSLLPANTTFTQMTFNSFDVESWHDYLKFDGPSNFILFANETTNRVIMTGYPNATINSQFNTDSDINFSGYNYTASSVTATVLLAQYEGYNATSSAQVMRSPMYVTSADDEDLQNKMDIMAINLDNKTESLADAWPEYVRLVGLTDMVIVYDETSTGFKINWTVIASTKEYAISIKDSGNTSYYNKEKTTSTSFNAMGLPSGTTFTVTVFYINKKGNEAPITANGTTLKKDPTGLNIKATQTAASLSWEVIPGAVSYEIELNGRTKNIVGTSTTFPGLQPGESYNASITARYKSGISSPYMKRFQTVPGNVTGLVANIVRRTSVLVGWNLVKGATGYNVSYNGNGGPNFPTAGKIVQNVTGLTPGTSYTVWVIAVGESGVSFPETIDVTTKLLNGDETVSLTAKTMKSVTVSWDTVEAAEKYFVTTRRTGDGQIVASEKVEPPKRDLQIFNLAIGTSYSVSVTAESKAGENHTLGNASVSTNLTAVKNARIEHPTNSSMTLTWDNITEAVGYKVVYWDETKGIIGETTRDDVIPPLPLSGLTSGSFYRTSITAKFEVGPGPEILTSGWTLPSNVLGLTVDDIKTVSFQAGWSSLSNTTYILTLRSASGTEDWRKENAITGQSHLASPGKKYTLAVRAGNPSGLSNNEVTINFETPLSAPTLRFDGISQLTFALKWNVVSGASEYYYTCSNTNKRLQFMGQMDNLVVLIDNLAAETSYTCTLFAVSDDGIENSTSDSITTANSACSDSTCLNGGTCSDVDKDEFQCACTTSYEGTQCQRVMDWCGKGHALTCAQDNATICHNNPEKGSGECRCRLGYNGDPKVGCIAYCEKDERTVSGVKLHFKSTYAGSTVYSDEVCVGKQRSKASVLCKKTETGAVFDKVIYSPCSETVDNVIPEPQVSENVTSKELEEQTAQLQLVTSGSSNKVPPEEVEKVSQYLESVSVTAETKKVDIDVLSNIANAANNLIQSNSLSPSPAPSPTSIPDPTASSPASTTTASTISREEESKKIKKRILKTLNSLANHVEIPENTEKVVITTPTMVLEIVDTPADTDKPLEFAPVVPADDDDGSGNGNENITVRLVEIELPASAVNKAKSGNGNVRVSFFLHRDSTLFPDKTRSPGPIVAANVGEGERIANFDGYIKMKFAEKRPSGIKTNTSRFSRNISSYECAYWDVNSSLWLTDGCYWDLNNISNPTGCACDHLTNFALLVSKEELAPNIALEIVSIIGLSLSMIGLILTIIIHAVKEEVRKRRPTQILFHICTNLVISSIIFIVGVDRNDNRVECTVIATFMHYFYLTSWTWMTVYAYDMYRSLVQVFGVGKSRYMTKCTLFGYGAPLLITLIDVGVTVGYVDPRWKPKGALPRADGIYTEWDHLTYRESAYVAENVCWIHNFSLSIGFLLPVAIMLAFNIFVYAMVIRTLYQRGKSVQSSAKKTGIKDNILISITLIASTGIAWIFAYLMLLSPDPTYLTVMSWIFATLNSVQGLVIFLSTCVRNENMRKIWLQPLRQCCSSSGSRIRLLSSKRKKFDVNTKSTTNESVSFSSSTATKGTHVQSISAKPLTSESAI